MRLGDLLSNLANIRDVLKTRVFIGETLSDVRLKNLSQEGKKPSIPRGLCVEDEKGNRYVVGQEEWNSTQDISGILLYDASKKDGSYVEPLLSSEELQNFRVVGFNKDKVLAEYSQIVTRYAVEF
jgi:hypothetical protein